MESPSTVPETSKYLPKATLLPEAAPTCLIISWRSPSPAYAGRMNLLITFISTTGHATLSSFPSNTRIRNYECSGRSTSTKLATRTVYLTLRLSSNGVWVPEYTLGPSASGILPYGPQLFNTAGSTLLPRGSLDEADLKSHRCRVRSSSPRAHDGRQRIALPLASHVLPVLMAGNTSGASLPPANDTLFLPLTIMQVDNGCPLTQ
jgi:hypothetical protein